MQNILINGQAASQIDVRDRGFQYGDGVFETIACKNGQLEFWQAHMQRLADACERLNLPAVPAQQWLDDIAALQPQGEAVIKLILTRGVSGRGYAYSDSEQQPLRVCALYPWPDYPPQNQQGINAIICKTPVSMNAALAGIKHLNRLDNVLARNEWRDPHIAEGLMLDHQQHVIEGTMSNVFCVLDDQLYTPSLDRCGVRGVMREQIIQLAQSQGITLNEIEISQQNFLQMDEIFVSNSLIGIWPVSRIVDQPERQYTTSMAQQLQRQLQQLDVHRALEAN
ncbi:MAG TPA: aminodeoxychorismate lyase [Gammaproteobacteria bacterium]